MNRDEDWSGVTGGEFTIPNLPLVPVPLRDKVIGIQYDLRNGKVGWLTNADLKTWITYGSWPNANG